MKKERFTTFIAEELPTFSIKTWNIQLAKPTQFQNYQAMLINKFSVARNPDLGHLFLVKNTECFTSLVRKVLGVVQKTVRAFG